MIYSLPSLNWVVPPASGEGTPSVARPLNELVDAASVARFDGIGVDLVSYREFARRGGSAASLASLLATTNLRATDVGVLIVGSEGSRESAAALAELGAAIGATICITAVVDPALSLADAADIALECIAAMGSHPLRLAVEFFPYGPIATLEHALELCTSIGWDNCGLLIDAWHFFHSGEPWDLFKSLDRAQIALVHADDAAPPLSEDLAEESRFRRVPLGEGCLAISSFAAVLRDLAYDGVVSLEVLSRSLRALPAVEVARRLRASVADCWIPAVTQV
jgi:sugar phosphate isomerase/epimerase